MEFILVRPNNVYSIKDFKIPSAKIVHDYYGVPFLDWGFIEFNIICKLDHDPNIYFNRSHISKEYNLYSKYNRENILVFEYSKDGSIKYKHRLLGCQHHYFNGNHLRIRLQQYYYSH